MSATRTRVFAVLVAVQLLVPLAVIGVNEVALARGTEVRLRTVPVDPLDPFRGRYVTLRYDFSSLPGPPGLSRGDAVYVPLRREPDGIWSARAAVAERPADGTFLRGRVTNDGPPYAVEYGLETYYADEEEARSLEREARGRLLVDAVVGDDGRARITAVEAVR